MIGFTSGQAKEILEEKGYNVLKEGKKKSTLEVFLSQFADLLVIILIIAAILKSFRNNPYVERAFYGLRPASTGLIAAAGLSVIASNLFFKDVWQQGSFLGAFNWKGIALAVILWMATNVFKKTKKFHPIVFIGFSALVGIIFKMG